MHKKISIERMNVLENIYHRPEDVIVRLFAGDVFTYLLDVDTNRIAKRKYTYENITSFNNNVWIHIF